MQLATLDRSVTSSGIGNQNEMGMVLDGTAFKILSDGLYSDKIGSMVRETYSNAVDSHIMAGEPDKAGWIQLPNALDPTYIVRDEGIGLDEEGVMSTATTYFGSTKRDDNTGIGGFGLGFKSPFAYSDQWTIVAVKDGVSRMFSAYMNDLGVPQVAMLASEKTSKPNGVEIRVPVKANDVSRFRMAVAEQLQFFNPRPSITGGQVEWPEQEISLQGDNYELHKVRDAGYYGFNSKWKVLVGPVSFPLDKTQMTSETSSEASAVLNGTNGLLRFDIGEVSPSPSRESLQYNPATVKAISARLEEVAKAFKQDLTTSIAKAENYFKACGIYRELESSLHRDLKRIIQDVDYKGRKLDTSFLLSSNDYPGMQFFTFDRSDLNKDRFGLRDNRANCEVNPCVETRILIDDLPSYASRQAARIKRWWEELPEGELRPSRVIVLRYRDEFPASPQQAIDSLGGFPAEHIINLSTLEPPEIQRSATSIGRNARALPGIRKVRRGSVPSIISGKTDVDYCSETVSGAVTPGFYVITEHNIPVGKGSVETMLRLTSYLPGDVYFVPKSISDRLSKEDGWVDFVETFRAKVDSEKASVVAVMKLLGEADALNNRGAIAYNVESFMRGLRENGVAAPARTRSSFWKLYRRYCELASIKLTPDQELLQLAVDATSKSTLLNIRVDTASKFEASLKTLFVDFKSSNEVMFEVLDNRRHSFPYKVVTDLANKLA